MIEPLGTDSVDRGGATGLGMTESFFERPILNSPYAYPGRHWELDPERQPTNRILENRRRCELITPEVADW
jgi:hypothetical protein